MKRNLLLLLVLLSAFAKGQITITHSDFQSAFAVGVVYESYSTPWDRTDFEIFVGEPSASPQFWDMTGVPVEYTAVSYSVQPSTAPFIGDFPTSNLVLYEKYWFGPGDSLYTWNYKEMLNDRILLHGESDETSVAWTYDPPVVQSMMPMTLGTNWISQKDSTYYMPDLYTIGESEITIDAFGTLKISSGEFACLRMRVDQRTISHTPVGVDTLKTRSYNFYTREMIEVNVMSIYEEQFDLTTILTSGVKLSGRQGSLGIPPVRPPVVSLISSIYPNPAANAAEVEFSLKQSARVSIRLNDLSGREVAEICSGIRSAGEHKVVVDVSDIPEGIYFCRLEANGWVETRKLVICR